MFLFLFFLILLASYFAQDIPIPAHRDGFILPTSNNHVKSIVLEVYYDLLCPDSA